MQRGAKRGEAGRGEATTEAKARRLAGEALRKETKRGAPRRAAGEAAPTFPNGKSSLFYAIWRYSALFCAIFVAVKLL